MKRSERLTIKQRLCGRAILRYSLGCNLALAMIETGTDAQKLAALMGWSVVSVERILACDSRMDSAMTADTVADLFLVMGRAVHVVFRSPPETIPRPAPRRKNRKGK